MRVYGFCYNLMGEETGPYYYDCPQSTLEAGQQTPSEHPQAWRDKIDAAAWRFYAVQNITTRDVVTLDTGDEFEVTSVAKRPRRLILGTPLSNPGRIFRLPMARIMEVTPGVFLQETTP